MNADCRSSCVMLCSRASRSAAATNSRQTPRSSIVQIIVGTADALNKPCELASATTVFVVGKEPFITASATRSSVSHAAGK